MKHLSVDSALSRFESFRPNIQTPQVQANSAAKAMTPKFIRRDLPPRPEALNSPEALLQEPASEHRLHASASLHPEALLQHQGDGIKGPKGIKGLTGDGGPIGAVGPPGGKGNQGAQGPQGIKGMMGPMGLSGPKGFKGQKGLKGNAGMPFNQSCSWSDWGAWTVCSRTCGSGIQRQERSVAVQQQGMGAACAGHSFSTQRCNTASCPLSFQACIWGSWQAWQACPATCTTVESSSSSQGANVQRRERWIQTHAQAGGAGCAPSVCSSGGGMCMSIDFQACNTVPCPQKPVNCEWGSWASWGVCSMTCGPGVQRQERNVTVFPMFNGTNCQGLTYNFTGCNKGDCPNYVTNCTWGNWFDWEACTTTCGGGQRQRDRFVQIYPQNGGLDCNDPSINGGITGSFNIEQCNTAPCVTTTVPTTTLSTTTPMKFWVELIDPEPGRNQRGYLGFRERRKESGLAFRHSEFRFGS